MNDKNPLTLYGIHWHYLRLYVTLKEKYLDKFIFYVNYLYHPNCECEKEPRLRAPVPGTTDRRRHGFCRRYDRRR